MIKVLRHTLQRLGYHARVVLQKIVMETAATKESYLGHRRTI
ncbi:hypothetical protein [Ohtaekwangia sp.]